MATVIADTACIDPRAEYEDEVEIGPYCVIGPGVRIGRGTRLIGHVHVCSNTTIGARNTVWPFAVLGGDPPGAPNDGPRTQLIIGDENSIRESATISRGSSRGENVTHIGSRNIIMPHSHVAADCQLGDFNVLSPGAILGEGVRVESGAHISSGVVVYSYVTIGECGFVGGPARAHRDVPRFMLVDGSPARVRCVNIVALKKRGLDKSAIDALHETFRLIFRAKMSTAHASEILASHDHLSVEVRSLLEFLQAQQDGRHGRARERLRPRAGLIAEMEGDGEDGD